MERNPLAGLIDYRLRPGTDEDLGYVIGTWSRSAWPLYEGETRKSVFAQHLKRYLDHLLADPDTGLVVACDAAEPKVLYGWLLHTSDVVRFIYVRSSHRNAGIARALVEQVVGVGVSTIYTSSRLTLAAQQIAFRHDIVHTPFNDR